MKSGGSNRDETLTGNSPMWATQYDEQEEWCEASFCDAGHTTPLAVQAKVIGK